MTEKYIDPEQLCIGLHIRLESSWMEHSFMITSFKIKNDKQLNKLINLGLKKILFNPEKSDCEPLPEKPLPAPTEPQESANDETSPSSSQILQERRARLSRCEKAYSKTVSAVREVMNKLKSQPALALKEADSMVGDMVENLMDDRDTTVHLINMKNKSESTYFHSINVSILALMLGKKLGLNEQQMHTLGIGALFHDLGHEKVPDKILRKGTPLNKAEMELYKFHPTYGVEIANKIGSLPKGVITIIQQHHEMVDGSGFPDGLKGSAINELAQIICLVNTYDNLCNQIPHENSLSPYEAIASMFTTSKERFDPVKLTTFITQMGVYPPGSTVILSDERIAVVLSVNMDDLLNPNLIIYDPAIPKEEAMITCPKEKGLSILESIQKRTLSKEIWTYLDLGESVSFFIDVKNT